MAQCPNCGAPVKAGDWTCGACGAPVAGAGLAPVASAGLAPIEASAAYGGVPQYQPQSPASSEVRSSSGLVKIAIAAGLLAVLAIVLVWFFALRGPATSGEEFVGSWTAATGQGIASVDVVRRDDAFSVTLTGSDPSQKITVPAHLDGAELVVTMDDFSQMAGAGQAGAIKAALQAMAGEFKVIFSSVATGRLDLRIVGTAANGADFDQTIPLSKAVATGT